MFEPNDLTWLYWVLAGASTFVILFSIVAVQGQGVRYIIAMVVAVLSAMITTLFFSSRVASYVTGQFTYESPDGVEFVHALAWFGACLVGLAAGWLIGWALSWPVVRHPPRH